MSGTFGGIGNGGSANTGAMSFGDVEALQKALSAGYGTDVAALTGGAALRVQSLDAVLQSTIQDNTHFVLHRKLAKSKPGATVDEWTEQDRVGGHLGGSTNTEAGTIRQATGSYARRVGLVKFLMVQRQVTLVQTLQNTIADSEATEYNNGALQLLSDAEYLHFEGDASVVPTEYDGIHAQMRDGVAAGQVDGANIIDWEGKALESIHAFNQASAQIRRYGNFGTLTDAFWNQDVQADMDNGLDPAFRFALGGPETLKLGSVVTGIRTGGGVINTNEDVFIRDSSMCQPFEVIYATTAASLVGLKPANVVADASVTDAQSKFGAAHAGNYYYLVTGINAEGQSTGFVSAQVAVAAGKKVALTITRSAGALETGYVIYRSRLNGGNSVNGSIPGEGSDFREMARIGVAGATTTFTDLNRDIPGTTKVYLLNMAASAHAINWRQMLPMVKFALYPTNAAIIPWAQLLFGYLRITKRKQHAIIKNVLPKGYVWRPFGV